MSKTENSEFNMANENSNLMVVDKSLHLGVFRVADADDLICKVRTIYYNFFKYTFSLFTTYVF